MKTTRRLDSQGRVVIPREYVERFGLKDGVRLEPYGDALVLRGRTRRCCVCGKTEDLRQVQGQDLYICGSCLKQVQNTK